MADVEVRLHICPNELMEFFHLVKKKYGVYFFGMIGQTGEPKNIDQVDQLLKSKDSTRSVLIFGYNPELLFQNDPPVVRKPLPSYLDGKLQFILPVQNDDGLNMCNVSARTYDDKELICWKGIAKDLRKLSPLHEVEIYSSYDGKVYPSSKHRISEGAKQLYNEGFKLYEIFNKHFYIIKS